MGGCNVREEARRKNSIDAFRWKHGMRDVDFGTIRLSSISALLRYSRSAGKSIKFDGDKLYFEAYGVRFEALPEGEVTYRG